MLCHLTCLLITFINYKLLNQYYSDQQFIDMASNIFAQLNNAKTKRQFVNHQSISRHLHCFICSDVFQDPVRTICGHTFCYICIENWALVQKKCPICKQSIRSRKLEKDLIALNIIDDLIARCVYPQCNQQLPYSILKKHQRKCQHKPKKSLANLSSSLEIVDILNNEQYCFQVIELDKKYIQQ